MIWYPMPIGCVHSRTNIVMPDSVCEEMIHSHYIDFHHKHPHISMRITTADTRIMFDMTDHNEADAIITPDSHSYRKDYVIACETLLPMHFVANARSRFAGRTDLTMKIWRTSRLS